MTHKIMLLTTIAFTFVLWSLLPVLLAAQPAPPADEPINNKIRKEAIDSLSSILMDGYVDISMAKKMIAKINTHYKTGKYDTISSGLQFATQLTKDLVEISRDKHIAVEYVNDVNAARSDEGLAGKKRSEAAFMDAVNHGFDKVERLAGNVGLLELRTFASIEKAAAKIDAAMALLAHTDALIIDLRYNAGGHTSGQYLASYLLGAEKPVLLQTMKWKSAAGNQPVVVTRKATGPGLEQQAWTYQVLPGPCYNKPVFIVVSEITASAAEAFTYSLQALKRVTVVGGTSAGAANPGGTDQLTANFQVFIPRGRPVNPITHTNWEGIGIKPDVASSFENSVKVAYIHALEQIEKSGAYAGPEPLRELIDYNKKQVAELEKN